MATKSTDRMSYGITILIFGFLFLLQKLGVLAKIPYGDSVIGVASFFFIAAVVFLITQPKKALGWIFLAVTLLLNADLLFGWVKGYSYLLVPVGLIIAGLAMILSGRK